MATLVLVPGCAVFKDPVSQARVAIALESAAKTATVLYVRDHPQARDNFLEVAALCEALSTMTEASPEQLHAILSKLPIKELNGTTAQIVVGTAQTTYRIFLAGRAEAEVPPAVREFAKAIAKGIREGL